MKRAAFGLFAVAMAAFALPAFAQAPTPAGLQLTADNVVTDPAGAFVNVRVKNAGTTVISQIDVGCQFLAKGKVVGNSTTTLYASVPGVTGIGQVRLMGATGATDARCGILKAN
ncbi:hypothetical protein [Azorhizobium sp. AG788]|uniref:hypothetical protein n=1 Tax=Azorhizobium sp. AG788 TaxID=2183897 RepID=UPI00313A44B9